MLMDQRSCCSEKVPPPGISTERNLQFLLPRGDFGKSVSRNPPGAGTANFAKWKSRGEELFPNNNFFGPLQPVLHYLNTHGRRRAARRRVSRPTMQISPLRRNEMPLQSHARATINAVLNTDLRYLGMYQYQVPGTVVLPYMYLPWRTTISVLVVKGRARVGVAASMVDWPKRIRDLQ